jgi:hypothetical protein
LPHGPAPPGKDLVAIIMAIGLATALNLITLGVLFNAFFRGRNGGDPSISENATQILIASFGGMIGVIGSYIGYRAGAAQAQAFNDATEAAKEMDDT